nr:DsbA family protein [Nonomuraea sp. SYSU D8015]
MQDAVAEKVMQGHFIRALDISRPATLARLAAEAGFDQGVALLSGGGGDAEVKGALLIGKARGITTSPTLVVNGQALAGAQPAETIAAFLRAAAAQLGRARAALEDLVAADPGDSYARLLLGRTLHRQGLAEQAAVHLRLAGAMTPEYA